MGERGSGGDGGSTESALLTPLTLSLPPSDIIVPNVPPFHLRCDHVGYRVQRFPGFDCRETSRGEGGGGGGRSVGARGNGGCRGVCVDVPHCLEHVEAAEVAQRHGHELELHELFGLGVHHGGALFVFLGALSGRCRRRRGCGRGNLVTPFHALRQEKTASWRRELVFKYVYIYIIR